MARKRGRERCDQSTSSEENGGWINEQRDVGDAAHSDEGDACKQSNVSDAHGSSNVDYFVTERAGQASDRDSQGIRGENERE